MGEESLILRLTSMALAYVAFTYTIETSKRPIRKIMESSSVESICDLLTLASSLWKHVSTSADANQRKPHAEAKKKHSTQGGSSGWGVTRAKSTEGKVKQEQLLPVAKVSVDDLCGSCREGWTMAEEMFNSFKRFGEVTCVDELFQPCRLCSERAQGLSRLERTLFDNQESPPPLSTDSSSSTFSSRNHSSISLYATT